MRYRVAQNIKKLQSQQYKRQIHTFVKTKEEFKIADLIREKLIRNNAVAA